MTRTPLSITAFGDAETERCGRALAQGLAAGDVLALHGDLGAGKTTLVRGIAAGLGVDPAAVTSPTFVLHRVYRGGRLLLHHIDLYRLGRGTDIGELDIDLLRAEGVVAVEWAELADVDLLDAIHVRIDAPAADHRVLRLDAGAPPRVGQAFLSMMAGS